MLLERSNHTTQCFSGRTRQAPKRLQSFTCQFYLPAGDGHTSTPAVHWQLGRWGRVNGEGRVGESQLRKPDCIYTVKSMGCLIPTALDMRQVQEKGLMANVQGKKRQWKKFQAQLRNQGKEQSRWLQWGTGDDDESTKHAKGS